MLKEVRHVAPSLCGCLTAGGGGNPACKPRVKGSDGRLVLLMWDGRLLGVLGSEHCVQEMQQQETAVLPGVQQLAEEGARG